MKIIRLLLIAIALFTTGNFALAAPGPAPGNHDRHGHDRRSDRQHDNRHQRHQRHDNRRHDNRRHGHYGSRPAPPRYYPARHHRWQRGHRYNGPVYVVHDYGHYRLRHPPRGYRWVRSNNDYLLVAIATGIILDMAIR